MAVISAAVADLSFGLKFAASRYRSYAFSEDTADNSGLFLGLAEERELDAANLDSAAGEGGLELGQSTFDDQNAGPLLGMGVRDPNSAISAVYRVQRAENTLERMTAQLISLSSDRLLGDALGQIRSHINQRRGGLRAARLRAQNSELSAKSASGMIEGVGRSPEEGHEVELWFGTNRQCNGRGQFVGERADSTSYGRCRVFVPQDRAIGSLGRGLLGRIIKGDNRVRVLGVDRLGERQFWSLLADTTTSLDEIDQHGLVFLHGYNTKFEDAARRTAQLKVDLAHGGPAAFFSWPSLGYPAGYTGDEAAIEGSETAIRNFLVDFAERSGASLVHIIAHSMGNRGLLRAMDAIASAAALSTPVRFGQIFLAAPDVDSQLFQNLAGAYRALSTRATLYVTKNDKAIGLSRRLHRFARVGLTPPVVVMPGIDTIDASRVNLDRIGHSYVSEMRPVLADIHRLIKGDTAPEHRFGLRKALGGKAGYWEFIP
ncbi:alpha/beta hydrolase [Novosphingobium tardum]|uniref:Alpha/beta hydrolase n=1 Tax=Novosphingobium tardum TaxID=1538021 RepID=A0ABV8RQ01_9SPHN